MDLTPPSATAGADRLPSPGGPSHRTSIKRTASAELHGSSRRPEIAASDAPSSSNRAVVIERAGSQSHEGAITLELSTVDWMTEDPGPRLSLRKGLLTSSHDEAQHRMLTHVWAQLISGQVRFLIETETAEADGSAIIELTVAGEPMDEPQHDYAEPPVIQVSLKLSRNRDCTQLTVTPADGDPFTALYQFESEVTEQNPEEADNIRSANAAKVEEVRANKDIKSQDFSRFRDFVDWLSSQVPVISINSFGSGPDAKPMEWQNKGMDEAHRENPGQGWRTATGRVLNVTFERGEEVEEEEKASDFKTLANFQAIVAAKVDADRPKPRLTLENRRHLIEFCKHIDKIDPPDGQPRVSIELFGMKPSALPTLEQGRFFHEHVPAAHRMRWRAAVAAWLRMSYKDDPETAWFRVSYEHDPEICSLHRTANYEAIEAARLLCHRPNPAVTDSDVSFFVAFVKRLDKREPPESIESYRAGGPRPAHALGEAVRTEVRNGGHRAWPTAVFKVMKALWPGDYERASR